MAAYRVLQLKQGPDWGWTVERSALRDQPQLSGFYIDKAEAQAEVGRLTALEEEKRS
jgi:hypothetical protein